MNLIEKAECFATYAHGSINQQRKYTGEPYINHPRNVAKIVQAVTVDEEVIAAAWLHDVVEDTPVTLDSVFHVFGAGVGELVAYLTDISKPEDGNRAARKALDRQHIAQAPAHAKTVKLADLIDNTKSIVQYDPEFARIYLAEKRLLLEVLKEGDLGLWSIADAQVRAGITHIDTP